MTAQDHAHLSHDRILQSVHAQIVRIRGGDPDEVEAAKEALIALAREADGARVQDRLNELLKSELLEVQWEIEEVLEAVAPPKAAPAPEDPAAKAKAEAPEAPEDPNKPLTSADLNMVYDDPRGLMLHKTKKGDRWFATQVDPTTRQPQTFELHPSEITQLKAQLAGSPYWLLGAG